MTWLISQAGSFKYSYARLQQFSPIDLYWLNLQNYTTSNVYYLTLDMSKKKFVSYGKFHYKID